MTSLTVPLLAPVRALAVAGTAALSVVPASSAAAAPSCVRQHRIELPMRNGRCPRV